MPRWKWLRDQEKHLTGGTVEQLVSDLQYCRIRMQIAPLKSERKSWEQRRALIERAIGERFGEAALTAAVGSSRAFGKTPSG